ncbi:MAG: sugar phosphate isomerase/epimerase [Verrucomicrobia bacterium]|nr:sugar phosphate isomerase/epimerase [Verrucomicrobiota bacterium]MBI3871396.1 sugar phosphate isomerase/epimerase [Verrucomicrobiota bacterium]
MQFGICNEIFQGWKIDDTLAFAKETGYDAVEIAPFTLARWVTDIPAAERSRIREAARRIGVRVSGIHWVLAQTEGLHLTHPDPAVRGRTSAYFRELAQCCSDLGGQTIVVGSPKQRNVMDGVTYEQAFSWAGQVFQPALELAATLGVTICFEPLAPSETNFINTAAEAIRFVHQFKHPQFKIILDVKAMSSESKPIPQIIRESAPHFRYFHANDRNLKGPGFGDVDFVPIAAALRETGYDGVVSVEVFNFDEGPEVIARKSLEYLRASFRRH